MLIMVTARGITAMGIMETLITAMGIMKTLITAMGIMKTLITAMGIMKTLITAMDILKTPIRATLMREKPGLNMGRNPMEANITDSGRRWKSMPIMLFADTGFAMWLVFNEHLSLDTIIAGLIVIAMLTFFLYRLGMWNPARDKLFLARIIPFIFFLFNLVIEVCKANIHMIGIVLSDDPNARISPRIVAHKTKLRTQKGRVALSSSITLTPGTVTVDVGDDCVYVHAIDDRSYEGLNNSALERRLLRMEEGLR